MNNSTNNTTSTQNTTHNQYLYDQFKLFLSCAIVVMIIFLIFFVYNLVKCYLPKIMAKSKPDNERSEKKAQRMKYSNLDAEEEV